MKIAWATDCHLNFLASEDALIKFCKSLTAGNPSGIVITGDISVADQLVYHLSVIEKIVERPVYFVAGNHDFYGTSIEAQRRVLKDTCNMSQYLRYLSLSSYVTLTPKTAIVGHDGWYDAHFGAVAESRVIMNDWTAIGEYATKNVCRGMTVDVARIVQISRDLAQEAVKHVAEGIKAATRYHKTIIIATHVPPFNEAHFHEGEPGDVTMTPWFTSGMMGMMLRQAAASYPAVQFEVFAGHTHGNCDVRIAKNLNCHVGGAVYGAPTRQEPLINVD